MFSAKYWVGNCNKDFELQNLLIALQEMGPISQLHYYNIIINGDQLHYKYN